MELGSTRPVVEALVVVVVVPPNICRENPRIINVPICPSRFWPYINLQT
jgi:hypothetical protein